MTLGFVGTGTISTAMIEGLRLKSGAGPIVVSPRNADIAKQLAERFADITIAADNQDVLDKSDTVVLAVRPQIAGEVLPELKFRVHHRVISLIATVSLDWLRQVTAPAASVTRAVPLPPVARAQGPTAVFPADPEALALFDRLGTAIALDDEAEFDTFSTATAIMGSYFAFAFTITEWMTDHGVSPDKAHAFMAQMLEGLGSAAASEPGKSFAQLSAEHQTLGGINEQVFKAVTRDGIMPDLDQALDSVLERLQRGRGLKQ